MDIRIIKSLHDAHTAEGITVVIDVFRAFSFEAYLFGNNAAKIVPVQTLEEAYALKKENPDYLLAGERGGLKQEGFDYGNSPTEVVGVDFSGKTIIHTTSNGTRGLLNAVNAEVIIAGSFLIADSIIKFINKHPTKTVSLLSTSHDVENDNEDLMLAYYLRDTLQGVKADQAEIKKLMEKTSAYSKLFNELGVPKTDFDLCLDFNKFNFVIKKEVIDGRIYLVREDIN